MTLPKLPGRRHHVGRHLAQREAHGLLPERRPLAEQPLRLRRSASTAARRLTDTLNKEIDAADLVESEVVRFKSFDGDGRPEHPLQAAPGDRRGQGARPGLGARRPRRPDPQGLQRAHPVPGQPRLRRARHQQPRQLGLRQDLLHRRRPEARQGAALGLRGGQEVPGRRCPTWTRTASASSAAATAATWCWPRWPSSRRSSRSASTSSASPTGCARWRAFPSWWEAQRVALYTEIGDPVKEKDDAARGLAAVPRGQDPAGR